jgi:hypothetical protein
MKSQVGNSMNGFTIAIIGLAAWALMMHLYYMPRFRRFVMALRIADESTWAGIGSPDGTMFGSPSVPPWGYRMVKYVWRKQYEKVGNEDLRLAGQAFRKALIAAQGGMLALFVLAVLFGRGSS